MEKIKILLLEDNPADAELIANELHKSLTFEILLERVSTKQDFVEALSSFKPHIVLSDYSLPQYDGLSALKDLKQINSNIPFIVVTGSLSEEAAADAIKSGAWDYVVKERLFRLPSALNTALKLKEEQDQTKRTQAQLLKSEERFRLISASAQDAILVVDKKGYIRFWNPAAEKIFGYKKEEMTGRTLKEFFAADEFDYTINKVFSGIEITAFEKYSGNTLELEAKIKNGKKIPIEMSLARLELGEEWNAIGIIRDISERKMTEAALIASEKRFRTLFEQSQDAIFESINSKIIRINRSFQKMFGYTLKELQDPNFNLLQIIADNSIQMLKDRMAQLKKGIFPDSLYEFTGLHKNGTTFECEVNITYIPVAEGYTSQGIIRDITARKKNEQEIRKLHQAVEQSPVSVVITDLDANIQYVNQCFCKNTGYSREEAIGQNPRILKSGKMDPQVYEDLWTTILKGETWFGELYNKKKNGDFYWEETVISPIADENNQPINYLSIKEDITARKQLEEQFRQAQKMEAVGHLAGGIAHDFNNLITIINGFSELLLKRISNANAIFPELNQINQAGQRAANLTRQLLAFSRKQILQPKIINVNKTLRDMEKMLSRLVGESIEFHSSYNPEVMRIKMDPGQLEQVLLNLVVNARDAMPNGGYLTIETKNIQIDKNYKYLNTEISEGWYVLISVSDNGIGMDAQIRSQIFEPFFTTKEKDKGTGLGLSTVYGIIKQSGGDIKVYSEQGTGTTFKIYLPVIREDVTDIIIKHKEISSLQGNETILVVEDESAVRQLTKKTLNGFGYNVITASTPKSALKILKNKKKKFHVLLTDVVMPEMSGKVLAQKALELIPNLKIIFMSGYTDEAIVKHGVLDSQSIFIHKPFKINELAEKIKTTLTP